MSKTIKVELDALDLVNLIRACHYASTDYRDWSECCGIERDQSEYFLDQANELSRLASRLEIFTCQQ